MSRSADADSFEAVDIRRPFSLFNLTDKRFHDTAPIRRFLTLARQREASVLIIERVSAREDILSENEWLRHRYDDYSNPDLLRISIWKTETIPTIDMDGVSSDTCVGYAILKRDRIPSIDLDRWHIYEAVLSKYPHEHNYCHAVTQFAFTAGKKEWHIKGCLYAQQNGLNKACAQVAIRSVVATRRANAAALTYSEINEHAAQIAPVNDPGDGLDTKQISHILGKCGVNHKVINYDNSSNLKTVSPFEKIIYSGIESGAGALMVFNIQGPEAPEGIGHIIPCFGHTFNEDAWAPQARAAYFQIGETIRYIPSRAWAGSFIVHDDNFGPDLSIPVTFLKSDQVSYVFELLPDGFAYSGALAEIASADYFYSILPNLPKGENPWLDRLLKYVSNKKLILRCVAISRRSYINELKQLVDWDGNREDEAVVNNLPELTSEFLWMVEVSIPDLFSTNKRKLGEILLNAANVPEPDRGFENFILARFPSVYVFTGGIDNPTFLATPSRIQSHTSLFCQDGCPS